jgi:hypothetical protein
MTRKAALYRPGTSVDSFVLPQASPRLNFSTHKAVAGPYILYDAGSSQSYSGSGTTWTDLSSSNINGTLVNGVGYTASNGGGLVFDGSNDYVTTGNLSFTPRCLSFWLYNNSLIPNNDGAIGGPSTYQALLSYGNTYGINFGGWTSNASGEAIHIWDTSTSRLTFTNQQVPVGFHNFVFNWNGSNYEIWVDGLKRPSNAGTTGHAQLVNYSNIPIRIGGSVNNGYYFFGNIYVFALYTSSLTDSEILQNFNTYRGRFGL